MLEIQTLLFDRMGRPPTHNIWVLFLHSAFLSESRNAIGNEKDLILYRGRKGRKYSVTKFKLEVQSDALNSDCHPIT